MIMKTREIQWTQVPRPKHSPFFKVSMGKEQKVYFHAIIANYVLRKLIFNMITYRSKELSSLLVRFTRCVY